VLLVRNVHAAYGKKEVLRGVNFELRQGEIVALLGGNGAGKSTILKVIAGLHQPTSGLVSFRGEEIVDKSIRYRQQKGVGYLLQGGRVFPSLTVEENIELAAQHSGAKELKAGYKEVGTYFPEIEAFRNRRAGLLSGGERQMLAIEMVLCQGPKVALLDEPTGALAPNLVKRILQSVHDYVKDSECSVLLVEQNVTEAKSFCTRSLLLREGVVKHESLEDRDE